MIKEFIEIFEAKKQSLEEIFAKEHVGGYIDVVRAVVGILHDEGNARSIDPARIHEIDDGCDGQGTLVYIIACAGDQPGVYWSVMVDYKSCSGCDTLQKIIDDEPMNKPTGGQVKDYMTLALHIVQGLKVI